MKNELNEKELKEINGGAISVGTGMLIVGGVVFLIGVLDGFLRPLKCN